MGQYLDNPSEIPHYIDVIAKVNAISKVKAQMKEEGQKSSEEVLCLAEQGKFVALKKKAVRYRFIWIFFSLPFEIVVVSALKLSQAGKFDGQGEMSSSCSV